jgi:hypothetical protein
MDARVVPAWKKAGDGTETGREYSDGQGCLNPVGRAVHTVPTEDTAETVSDFCGYRTDFYLCRCRTTPNVKVPRTFPGTGNQQQQQQPTTTNDHPPTTQQHPANTQQPTASSALSPSLFLLLELFVCHG